MTACSDFRLDVSIAILADRMMSCGKCAGGVPHRVELKAIERQALSASPKAASTAGQHRRGANAA